MPEVETDDALQAQIDEIQAWVDGRDAGGLKPLKRLGAGEIRLSSARSRPCPVSDPTQGPPGPVTHVFAA